MLETPATGVRGVKWCLGAISGEPRKDMRMVRKFFLNFRRSEAGAAMVEYAIALLVAAALGVTVFTAMGNQASQNASDACSAMGATSGC